MAYFLLFYYLNDNLAFMSSYSFPLGMHVSIILMYEYSLQKFPFPQSLPSESHFTKGL